MNMKSLMIALAAFVVGGAAHAITSEEIAAALDTNVGTYSFAGDAEWYADASTFHSGAASMRSGSIAPASSQTKVSVMTMTLNLKEACNLSFWYKTSCYDNTSRSSLNIRVDDATYTYCGEKDWARISCVLIPGAHTIKWEFQRYSTYSSGSNCAWVDNLSITPIMEAPTQVEVTDIKCKQRYPWNGMVDIDYTVKCEKKDAEVWVYPVGYDKDSNMAMAPRALSGDGVDAPVSNGTFRMTWKVTDDYPNFHSTAFTVKMAALVGAAPYMVVDLAGGVDALSYPVSYLSRVPAGGWSDEYKTTKMVFRMIPSGSFTMGSPSDELGRSSYEDPHGVVITKPYYLGVFECTQRQYQLVMGANPSDPAPTSEYLYKCPVNRVSYDNIRGSVNGAGWPTHNQVDANSFMGRLRSKVNMFFDLPTEAQWEYACRAGTSTALNSGKNLTTTGACKNMSQVGRFAYGRNGQSLADGKTGWKDYQVCVGQFLSNAWGLYDMHGNVAELCRDFWTTTSLGVAGVVDPKGATSSTRGRVFRGGRFVDAASSCRSAFRDYTYMSAGGTSYDVGFRVMCSPVAE